MQSKNPKDVRLAFFGGSSFSVMVLEELAQAGFMPAVVVTTPDAPKGRGLELVSPPLKEWARARSISVLQPEKLDEHFKEELKSNMLDVSVVASYGKIIPFSILCVPRRETLNVHPSLLPKYRGATPIPSQILADDKEIGVSIMVLDDKMDHGAIVSAQKIAISEWPMKASRLEELLARAGGRVLSRTLVPWIEGMAVSSAQDHDQATFTKKIEKKDGELDLSGNPYQNYLKFCAYESSIGTYFFADKEGKKIRVKIKDANYENDVFTPLRVVPEGGKEMNYRDFLLGFK